MKIDLRMWQLVKIIKPMPLKKVKEELVKMEKESTKYEYRAVSKIFADGTEGFEIYGRLKNPIYVKTI